MKKIIVLIKTIFYFLNPFNWNDIYKAHTELILYLIFGIATTIVSFIAYYVFRFIFPNTITIYPVAFSWVISVLFAYITNRIWVFKSKVTGFKNILKECLLFYISRLFTLCTDMLIMFLLVDLTKIENDYYELSIKIFSNIIVIILNFILSKIIIFRKKID